jgi:hypothetical protein
MSGLHRLNQIDSFEAFQPRKRPLAPIGQSLELLCGWSKRT